MKKEEIEKIDINNPDYEYTDIVDIPNVEEQLNDIVLSDELIERAGRFVEVMKIDQPVYVQKFKDIDGNEYEVPVCDNSVETACSINNNDMVTVSNMVGIDVHYLIINAMKSEIVSSFENHIKSRLFTLGWSHNMNIDGVGGYTTNDNITETPAYYYIYSKRHSDEDSDLYKTKSLDVVKKNDFKEILLQIIERYVKNSYNNNYPEYLLTNITIGTELQFPKEIELSERYSIVSEFNTDSLSRSGLIYNYQKLVLTDKIDNIKRTIKCYIDPVMSTSDTRLLLGRISKDYEGCKLVLYKSVDDLKMVMTYTKDENGNKIEKSKRITTKTRYSIDEYEHEKSIAEKNYMSFFISLY